MPKVTVILTSYNHAKYIRETIDSILNQTFKDFELIIWDDASIDESWEIIQSYKDERIKAFRNEESKRGVYGINKAISEVAQGEYIAIHHSDDVWELTKLEKQVKFLDENSKYGAVFTNAQAINEDSELFEDINHFYYSIFEQPNRTRYEWLNFFFYKGNALCHPSVMIRKECYDNCGLYRYGLALIVDFDMWIRLCMKYEIYVLPEKLTKFRVRDNEANSSGNTSATRIRGMNEHFFVFELFLQIQNIKELIKIFPQALEYVIDGQYIIEYVIASLIISNNSPKYSQLHALNFLYKLINNEEKALLAKRLYQFDYLDLIELSKKIDFFQLEIVEEKDKYINSLVDVLSEKNREIENLNEEINKRSESIEEKDKHINSLVDVLSEKNREIENLNVEINIRSESMEEKDKLKNKEQ